jgi:general stress protein 26
MAEPITTLDARFSDPDAVASDWSAAERVISSAELFWLTTVRADGRPHITPLLAIWLDGALHFSTGAEEQKAINLRANSNVVLTTGCNNWETGLDVMIEGVAVREMDDAHLGRLADAWTRKWDGRWRFEVHNHAFTHGKGEALVFKVRPTKILAFGHDPFTQTRHRFPSAEHA